MNRASTLEVRERLLAAAKSISPILTEQASADEQGSTLSNETVQALEQAGMFRLKLPAALGGAEADPATQILVLEELAYARTFGFYSEVEELRRKGLIRGGSLENAVVLDEKRIMNGPLRSKNEFVRHKMLDALGDLAVLGKPVRGRLEARRRERAAGRVRDVVERELTRVAWRSERTSELLAEGVDRKIGRAHV